MSFRRAYESGFEDGTRQGWQNRMEFEAQKQQAIPTSATDNVDTSESSLPYLVEGWMWDEEHGLTHVEHRKTITEVFADVLTEDEKRIRDLKASIDLMNRRETELRRVLTAKQKYIDDLEEMKRAAEHTVQVMTSRENTEIIDLRHENAQLIRQNGILREHPKRSAWNAALDAVVKSMQANFHSHSSINLVLGLRK